MTKNTKLTILNKAKYLFAVNGYEGFSMRTLATDSNVGLSSIYHFFHDKDEILKEIFQTTTRELGAERAKLPTASSAEIMLKDRLEFQFLHIEDVVFVLKYYLHFRTDFLKLNSGYLPSASYLHIKEVLDVGLNSGEFNIQKSEIDKEAKVMTHAINGFLLEYYPNPPKKDEQKDVIDSIHRFLIRSLTNRRVVMK